MFVINGDKSIHLTRGDIANIVVTAKLKDGTTFTFAEGDIVRFKVTKKGDYSTIILQKDVTIEEATSNAMISLTREDTKIGEIINKPVDYWYEVEINPETKPQTIIGHDPNGAKIFRLYPEGSDS